MNGRLKQSCQPNQVSTLSVKKSHGDKVAVARRIREQLVEGLKEEPERTKGASGLKPQSCDDDSYNWPKSSETVFKQFDGTRLFENCELSARADPQADACG